MSIDSNPSIMAGGGDISHVAASNAGAHLAAETQLSSPADIASARQFFQPAGTGAELGMPAFTTTGAESAVAGKAVAAASGTEAQAVVGAVKAAAGAVAGVGAEAAAMGAHAMAGIGSAVAGAAEISPMIQLIMRLPGLSGVAQDFFEWLFALFSPENLANVFDPSHWAELGNSLHSSLASLGQHAISGEHFQVSLSMLPSNAPFLQHLGMQAGHSMSDLHRISGTLGHGLTHNGISSNGLSLQNRFNVSGPLDLKKPQFEVGQSSSNAFRIDGKLSGTEMNQNFSSSALSPTQRIFSDQVSRQTSLLSQSSSTGVNNIVSNAQSPVGAAGSNLNISSNSFSGQEMGGMPANYRLSDGVMSGPSVSNDIGFHLSDSAPAAIDRASGLSPSGAVSDTLGGKELIASGGDTSMGGSYFRPQGMPGADAASTPAPTDSGMTGLKAEPLSLLKKAPHASIGHAPDKGVIDQIGHQSKGAIHQAQPSANNSTAQHSQGASDQVSHRGHSGADHQRIASKPTAAEHVAPKAQHNVAHHAKPQVQAEKAPVQQQQAETAQAPEQMQEGQAPEQQAATDQTAMNEAGTEKVGSYHVNRGDNLWDIAKKNLGDGSRWTEIYKMNTDVIGANPSLIHTGIDLKLPGADATQISDAGVADYTVQPGDNLWDIAKDKLGDGTRWDELFDANKAVIGDNPRMIFPGEHLQMPGGGQAVISQAQAPVATPASMQSMPQVDPNAMAPQAMAPQTAVPQQVSQMPAQESYLSGPGAAGAATLDPTQIPPSGPVSASLAPDLSFLYSNGKSN